MPMQFAYATRRQSHVDTRDGVGNREGSLCYLTRPAAVLDAPRRLIEGGPVHLQAADVGRRRSYCRGKLAGDRLMLRTGIGDARRVVSVDRSLRRLVRVAER